MIENLYVLKPSERFPEEMEAPGYADVLIELDYLFTHDFSPSILFTRYIITHLQYIL